MGAGLAFHESEMMALGWRRGKYATFTIRATENLPGPGSPSEPCGAIHTGRSVEGVAAAAAFASYAGSIGSQSIPAASPASFFAA